MGYTVAICAERADGIDCNSPTVRTKATCPIGEGLKMVHLDITPPKIAIDGVEVESTNAANASPFLDRSVSQPRVSSKKGALATLLRALDKKLGVRRLLRKGSASYRQRAMTS